LEFTQEAIDQEYRERSFNHPGFDYPLTYRRIRPSDTLALSHVIRKSHKHLRGYIGWAQYAGKWDFKQIQTFVNQHVNDEFPREHFLFDIGEHIVGMGSLAPMPHLLDIQIALWVAEGFHGHGIGSRIASTLEMYAFEVAGYSHLYYQHDASNEASKRLPQKLGYTFSHTFDERINAKEETGFWFSWVKDRPDDLPPGILQGADIEQFLSVRHGK
jgi:RimJ/RimL family protein N-acetyltransferase